MFSIRKKFVVLAVALMIIGLLIFTAAACSAGWDFTKLGTVKHETNTYDISEAFDCISIKTDTSDIDFLPSEDGKIKVVCYEKENMKHSVLVSDGTLKIGVVDTRKWYEHISWYSSPKITVYLPEGEYSSLIVEEDTGDIEVSNKFKFESVDIKASTGDVELYSYAGSVKIKTSTGDIRVENINANSINLSVSTGDVKVTGAVCEGDLNITVSTGKTYLTDTKCKNLISTGDTGDMKLQGVVATEKFSIERSTGDIKFEGCDAAEIYVTADTGDVKGTLLSDKVFLAVSDTGEIDVPKTISGGRCEITTDTGDIRLSVKPQP
jgi:DUF4097 and DUF4098 domain-containing protein YvlB